MLEARATLGLTTTHQVYTTVQGVLQAFRRRLTVEQAISFAQILPPVLRAIFVADWNVAEERHTFADRKAMTAEVQALRAAHNFAPDTAIEDVALALRRNVNEQAFEEVLARLPPGARDFWATKQHLQGSGNENAA